MRKPFDRLGRPALAATLLLIGACLSGPAGAEDLTTIDVTIKNHQFTPSEIDVPKGQSVILHIKNDDPTAEEFDSSALHVEKVIAGGTYGIVRLRPLGAGHYPFMGEYHSATAHGVVIAK